MIDFLTLKQRMRCCTVPWPMLRDWTGSLGSSGQRDTREGLFDLILTVNEGALGTAGDSAAAASSARAAPAMKAAETAAATVLNFIVATTRACEASEGRRQKLRTTGGRREVMKVECAQRGIKTQCAGATAFQEAGVKVWKSSRRGHASRKAREGGRGRKKKYKIAELVLG